MTQQRLNDSLLFPEPTSGPGFLTHLGFLPWGQYTQREVGSHEVPIMQLDPQEVPGKLANWPCGWDSGGSPERHSQHL